MEISAKADSKSNTIFHQWEAESKLISFILLMFSFAMIRNIELVIIMILVSAVMFFVSGISYSCLLNRWKTPAVLVLLMGLMVLFFSEGQILITAGSLTITREGLLGMIILISRVMSILTLIVILFETTPFLDIITAMHNLGLPKILADMTLFTVRYIFTLNWQLKQMKKAIILRGFIGNKISSWKEYAILIGGILVRSFEQSDRVYKALAIRGYSFEQIRSAPAGWDSRDKTMCYSFAVLALLISSIQVYLNIPGV